MRSLRTRLIAILLVALVPAVLLFVWYASAQRSAAETRLREDQVRRVQLRAQSIEQIFVDVRSELAAVAVTSEMAAGDWSAVDRLLHDIAVQEPAYAYIAAADTSGTVRAASFGPSGTTSVDDREWFRRVVATGQPAIGGFEKGALSGRPSVPVAVPVKATGGAVTGVLFASVPVSVIADRLAEVAAPTGAVLLVVDRDGRLLWRIPQLPSVSPGSLEEADIVRSALESASGSVDARGLDGIMRRYEFRSVSVDPKAPMHVIAGYDDRVVFEPERRQLLTGLGLLAAVALLEMGLAYAGASRWVLRPVDRLGEVTAAVASGDLTSRVGRLGGSSEFDALGAQFDAMAEALQDRVRELRESQELLTAEQQRLRTILEELPIGVALVDERGAVLEINEANERIWQGGARPGAFEEYPGLYDLYDLASGEQIAPDAYPAARTLGTGESVQQEYGFRRFDGTRGFLRITSVPVTAGAVRWAVVVTEDVSHRFLRQRLSEALNRIETVVHSSLKASEILQRSLEAGAVALGVDSGTIEIREGDGWVVRFEHGLPAGSVGRRLSDEEAPNAAELARTREPLAVADMAGDPGRDRGFVKEYGERAVLGAPLVVRDEVAGALLFYEHEPREFADVEIDFARRLAASVSLALDNATLYDELEERVQRRTADLEAANRELEAFSYSVSHDLRAPLRSIDGFSRALEEDYAGRLDADAGDYLERIRAGANRMAELIDALLSLSRLTRAEMRFEPVDVSAMAEEVAAELREREPERNLDLAVAPGMRAIADPSLLRVLLTNLLSNAWKFTAGCDPALIEVGMVRAEGERVYYVRDNGVGFDMAYSNKLFTAFQRLHAQGEYPGIGIGLTIAARVVHRHGGRIWTEAEPGKGATFYFTLE